MCGILGASFSEEKINKNNFANALNMLDHRGPDSTGVWISDSGKDALGFKRLSIIDLSKNADQPMLSSCGNYKIVFNGEIYNFIALRNALIEKGYIFKSNTDSEVLLNAYIEWGDKCLNKIDGMFAFAIIDSLNQTILISRDIAGQKPLYYIYLKKSLVFASEVKSLISLHPNFKEINELSIYDYFHKGYISRRETIFKKINKLPSSHLIKFDLKTRNLKVLPYFDLFTKISKLEPKQLISDARTACHELDRLLYKSVNNSLISDVPLGVLLSGGLDSSIIAAYASKCKSDLKTFSVIFPSHSKYNEQTHARKVADHLKTNHIEINAEEISPKIIEKMAYYYDEPFSDPSMIPSFLLSQAVKKHCSVVLGGDGGDELFGGYPSYARKIKLKSIIGFIPLSLRKASSKILRKIYSENIRGFSHTQSLGENFESMFSSFDPLFYPLEINDLMNRNIYPGNSSRAMEFNPSLIKDFFTRISVGDFYSFLSEDVLVKVDRSSMAHSLEVRSPYLSKEIIEFAFLKLHPDLKINGNSKKIILKLIGKSLLPDNFIFNRKQGFAFPLGNLLLQDNWREFFKAKITNFESEIFNKTYALKLLNKHGKISSNERKLFALVQFICWHEKHISF